jgi:hypothetical protein
MKTEKKMADVGSESGVRLRDVGVSVSFPEMRIDTESEYGRYVRAVNVTIYTESDDDGRTVLGYLECLLFDAESADADEETMWDEADSDSESAEFHEFLFSRLDFIRGRLLHRISPENYVDDDDAEMDDNWELCNVFVVSGGWWVCRPEVLAHVIRHLLRAIKFNFVCVDTTHIRTVRCADWRNVDAPKTPIRLREPFKKVVWSETAKLVDGLQDRFFWIAALFGDLECDLPKMGDDERVQIGALN